MPTDQTNLNLGTDGSDLTMTGTMPAPRGNPAGLGARWWFQVARVRLRFLLIVLMAGGIVSQWPLLRSLWDRWTWTSHHPASGSVSSAHEYFCPMDPGVISVWPAICPICNMDLVPRKKMEAQMLPEGVIARMQLSPYRIQLAGIRTATIESRPLKYEQTFTGKLRQYEDGSLGFDASLSEANIHLFAGSHPAELRLRSLAVSYSATVYVLAEMKTPQIRFVLNDSSMLPKGSIVTASVSLPIHESDEVLSVPESAVVDRGHEQLVYVESMPGTFDGVKVELGRRCGSFYPVTKGLKSGQKVASAGAFLIDAESRLNPSLAAGYFGANQVESRSSSAAPSPAVSPKSPLKKTISPERILSREDQTLADEQQICPVTELPLDSMGGPIPVMVAGQKVFICCAGCEQRLKDEPDKYLAKLKGE